MRFLASVLLLLMFTCSFVYAIDDDSLVLYCPFDEGNGDTVTDMKSGLVGIINGPQWTNDGKLNSALEFVNTTDNVEFADEDVLDIIGEITMEAWVFPSEVQADSGIMGRRSAANVGGYCMQWTAGKFEMWLNVNGGGWQGTRDKQTIVPETGEWHHVACIYDGEAELQYIDGELDIKFDAAGEIARHRGSIPNWWSTDSACFCGWNDR